MASPVDRYGNSWIKEQTSSSYEQNTSSYNNGSTSPNYSSSDSPQNPAELHRERPATVGEWKEQDIERPANGESPPRYSSPESASSEALRDRTDGKRSYSPAEAQRRSDGFDPVSRRQRVSAQLSAFMSKMRPGKAGSEAGVRAEVAEEHAAMVEQRRDGGATTHIGWPHEMSYTHIESANKQKKKSNKLKSTPPSRQETINRSPIVGFVRSGDEPLAELNDPPKRSPCRCSNVLNVLFTVGAILGIALTAVGSHDRRMLVLGPTILVLSVFGMIGKVFFTMFWQKDPMPRVAERMEKLENKLYGSSADQRFKNEESEVDFSTERRIDLDNDAPVQQARFAV